MDLLANFADVVVELRRIADALERAHPPFRVEEMKVRERPKESKIIRYGDEDMRWEKDQFKTLVRERGLSPKDEKSMLEEMLGQYKRQRESLNEDR